ncbi:MAG: LysR family transcriptional regulator [Solirubrobacteraceae bacterium]
MFDVRRLEVLLEVAGTGSFAAAAEALSFTPSAVSQQMSALERATGVRLFERGARGVSLTHAGRVMQMHAEAVMSRLAEAEADLQNLSGVSDSRLRFGSFTSATAAFAAEAYRVFAESHPDVTISYSDGEPYENLALLAANRLDIAVVFELDDWPGHVDYHGSKTCREPQFECSALFDDPYLLVLPADHPLAEQETVALEQLAGQRILAASPWLRTLQQTCADAGVDAEFDSSCRATGFEALQALVAVGRGLTFMPGLSLSWLRETLVARPVAGAPVRHVKTAVRAGGYRSSAVQAMERILNSTAGDLAAVPASEPHIEVAVVA